MEPDFISVIIPTCRRPTQLLLCLESVMATDYPACEVLIIDQDPTPRLQSLIRDKFSRSANIRYFHRPGLGASAARNMGVRESNGRILAFIDDDAIATPGWLQAIAEGFRLFSPAAACIAGRITPRWPGPRPAWYPKEREYLLGLYDIGDTPCLLPANDLPISANMAVMRDVILETNGFNEKLGPNYFRRQPKLTGEDALLGQNIRAAGRSIYYAPSVHVQHCISVSRTKRRHYLKRNFWEGVTKITEWSLLKNQGISAKSHLLYHSKNILKLLVRPIRLKGSRPTANPVATNLMQRLGDICFSMGVIRGVLGQQKRRSQ